MTLTPPQYAKHVVNEYKEWFDLSDVEAREAALLEMDFLIKDYSDNSVVVCYFKQVKRELEKQLNNMNNN